MTPIGGGGKSYYPHSHLHPDDGVYEKQHNDEQSNVRQCLERLDESPQQRSDALAATQQLHQSHDAEKTEKVYRYDARRLRNVSTDIGFLLHLGVDDVNETAEDNDEVENVPRIAKVVFEPECRQLEYELESEDGCEYHIEYIECIAIKVWLSVEFHRECDCVDHD